MNPDVVALNVEGDLRFAIGLGVVRRADVVLSCLDNIAARVYLSRHCYRMGKPSIDAGLDHLNGDVYTFDPPSGPCYECRLKEPDRKEFRRRQSCLKLAKGDVSLGKVPTAPTIAAITSGIQTQIAIRMLHSLPIPRGRRLGLYGMTDRFFDITLDVNDDCPAHGWMDCLADREVVETPLTAAGSSLDDLLAAIRAQVGDAALAGDLAEADALCEGCSEPMAPDLRARFDGSEALGHKTLAELGLPPLHIVRGRNEETDQEVLIELTGDLPLYFPSEGR
jgi:adenylyltransferase/sulfurtransferase